MLVVVYVDGVFDGVVEVFEGLLVVVGGVVEYFVGGVVCY